MRICPYCAHNNREGVFYCEDCGESLTGVVYTATRKLDAIPIDMINKAGWGNARIGKNMSILLRVREISESIPLPNEEVLFGRADPTSSAPPDIDLALYGGQEKGVSRRHAMLKRGDETITLVDLGSVNGTYLNGQRMIPNQPRVIRDGDEVRFGTLVCNIYFK